jgi:hypothetical protein
MRLSAIATAVLALALAACSGGGTKAPQAQNASPATSSASASPLASTPAIASPTASPAATKAGPATSPRATSSASASATAAAGGAYVPRRAGTYRFATSGKTVYSGAISGTYPMPSVTTLAVDPAKGSEQRSVRDLRDKDGNGRTTEMRLIYARQGLKLSYLKITSSVGFFSDARAFAPSPPPIAVPAGAKPGDHESFTLKGSGVTATVRVDVLRRETVTIVGTAVASLVVQLRTVFSGEIQGTDTSVQWLRPTDALLLKETDDSDATTGAARARTTYSATLSSLSPR